MKVSYPGSIRHNLCHTCRRYDQINLPFTTNPRQKYEEEVTAENRRIGIPLPMYNLVTAFFYVSHEGTQMGTNYYLRFNICENCNRYDRLHIGKSSCGWTFALHIYPDGDGPKDLAEWKRTMYNHRIFDEYGKEITMEEMINTIENREQEPDLEQAEKERPHMGKGAIYDSRIGLWRRFIDMVYCLGHGSGTYDLLKGEFG